MTTRALVLHPDLRTERKGLRSPTARLDEAVGLAAALDLEIVDARVEAVSTVRPGTLFGSGKLDEIKAIIQGAEIELVIVDGV